MDTNETTLHKKNNLWLGLLIGLILGAGILLGVRWFTYKPPTHVHYHANFAVYLKGEREKFADKSYYEEESSCEDSDTPSQAERAHMHDNVGDLIHVHDRNVTWGDFFQNLGWSLGDNFIKSRTTMYMADDTNKLHVILNGQDYTGLTSVANQVIKDKDRLLISYGDQTNAQVMDEYKNVPTTATAADNSKDPASCGGSASHNQDRWKHLL